MLPRGSDIGEPASWRLIDVDVILLFSTFEVSYVEDEGWVLSTIGKKPRRHQ